MSVIFTANVLFQTVTAQAEDCLCAQMCPSWMHGAKPSWLRQFADPNCPSCKGSGIETTTVSDAPSLNLANANACALLVTLGLPAEPYGSVALCDAEDAIERARALPIPRGLVRATRYEYGPAEVANGTVEPFPVRAVIGGISVDSIRDRVERFAEFVALCKSRGATLISWS
ncbi:MAG: hypothetical protein ACOY0T_35630 [Myxococcota bacterium]